MVENVITGYVKEGSLMCAAAAQCSSTGCVFFV